MKTAIILPYFGKLPDYFDLYLKSCATNLDYHWFVFTDDNRDFLTPSNVTIQKTTLADLKRDFENKLGFKVSLERPYKICDFRPAFGLLFPEYIKDFDYWGYCDMDMIFGKLSNFIDLKNLSAYTKILNRGHLTLYKNDSEVNNYFMLKNTAVDYKKVFTSPLTFGFDEWNGIHSILNENNIPQYHKEFILDVNPLKLKFESTKPYLNKPRQLFIYKNDEIYQVYIEDNELVYKEFAYIHFQKRNIPYSRVNKADETIVIDSSGFTVVKNNLLEEYFLKYKGESTTRKIIYSFNFLKKRISAKIHRFMPL